MRMKYNKVIATFLILFLAFSLLLGKDNQKNLYRVLASSKEKVDLLLKQEIDIVATNYGESIDIRCSEEKVKKLKQLGFQIELLSKTKHIFKVAQGFHNYEETKEFLQQRAALFSDISKLDSIGASVENRAIWALKISDNPTVDEDEPCFLVEGCIHGNENHSLEVCLFFIDYLLNNYGTNSEVTHWIENREIWVVPLVNPDGHERNQRRNVNNVDLNRNFGYWWGFSASAYGSAPFSEPETQAIRDLAMAIKPYGSLAFHTSGRVILYPWAYKDQISPDNSLFEVTSQKLIDSINVVDPQIQYDRRLSGSWYWHGGEHNDWMYSQYGMHSFTIELMTDQAADPSDHENEVVLPAFRVMLRRAEESGVTGIVTDTLTNIPILATVKVLEIFDSNQLQPRKSEPTFGRYIRFLTPGTYTLEVSASEYVTKTHQITISDNDSMMNLDIKLKRKIILLTDYVIDDLNNGNNNGLFNPGEKIELGITAQNTGISDAEKVYGILFSDSPYLTFIQDSVFWGNIDSTETDIEGLGKFRIEISNNILPGTIIDFQINFYDEQKNMWQSSFSERVQGFFDNMDNLGESQWSNKMIKTQNDWQRGIPNGKVGDPSSAHSGDNCWANDLGGEGWNGEYKNNVDNYLQMKTLNCSGWNNVYLQFYRWLNVLDGDRVYISVNDQIVWENNNIAINESSWSKQIIDISQAAGNKDSVVIRFGLQTDGSGTAGGWNIDDVLVKGKTLVGISSLDKSIPEEFQLYQNYPNPFNGSTSINYFLSDNVQVSIKIFDVLGREIKQIIDKKQNAGNHSIVWDGKDFADNEVASGLYFVGFKLSKGDNILQTKALKMMLVR